MTSRRSPSLDGIRAIAILLVIPHNLNLITEPVGLLAHGMVSYLDRGWIGVQLFFVLSGFLITGLLLDERGASNYYTSFFARRVLRVFPLYYATLVALFVVLPALGLLSPDLPRHAGSELSYWFFYTNWYGPFHQGEGSMPHFWSLAVEEQFYLVWPFLLRHRDAERTLKLCLAIAVVGLCVRVALLLAAAPTETIYEFSLARMDALALGGAGAAALRCTTWEMRIASARRAIAWIAIGALIIAAGITRAYTFSSPATLTIGYLALALAFAAFIVLAAHSDAVSAGAGSAFLRWTWLRTVGKYSYAMYVLHVPLHELVGKLLLKALGVSANPSLWVNAAYLTMGTLVSFAAGAISYRFVESRFLKLKTRFEPVLQAAG